MRVHGGGCHAVKSEDTPDPAHYPSGLSAMKSIAAHPKLTVALTAWLAMLTLAGCATPPPPPPTANTALPLNLQIGPDQALSEVLTTRGDETYRCTRSKVGAPGDVQGPNTQLLWTEAGSEGTLVDSDRKSIGTVTPGGYFVAYDGSYVKTLLNGQSQVAANKLTWTRYKARYDAAPRTGEGRFANVTAVQRIDTTGGLPPSYPCDLEGSRLLVPFSATYMLYRASAGMTRAVPLAVNFGTVNATAATTVSTASYHRPSRAAAALPASDAPGAPAAAGVQTFVVH